jgi:hypothetical protein
MIFFISILLVETLIFNSEFIRFNYKKLETQQFSVEDGIINGFEIINEKLISINDDPNITLTPLDLKVGYLSIYCTNPNPEAVAQIYFQGAGRVFSEDNTIKFSLSSPATYLKLPELQDVTSIRLDLTNYQGDSISCQEFILNPEVKFNFLRLSILLILSVGLLIGFNTINPALQEKIKTKLLDNSIWIMIVILIIIDLVYPITITWDSGHYLWLADVIKQANWENWDPVRYVIFPLFLFLSQKFLGFNQNALLIPMIILHLLLFITSYIIVVNLFQITKKFYRFIILLLIFFFIALDATIVGYFHSVLTEYVVATIAIISCFAAFRLYKSPEQSKSFYLWSIYFLLMVPLSWHIKQPYIGAAYFPFIIGFVLIVLREFSWKKLTYGLSVNLIIIAIIYFSTLSWNSFLISQENPMNSDRLVSTKLDDRLTMKVVTIERSPIIFGKDLIKRYIASTNFFPYDHPNRTLIYKPCLICGFQNKVVGQRMYYSDASMTNIFYSRMFDPYTYMYETEYNPPVWLNNIYQSTAKFSNFLYTVTNLLLPIFVVVFFVLWTKRKNVFNAMLLILAGTSLFNSLSHLIVLGSTLDRYLFMGYPLNLLILVILVAKYAMCLIEKNQLRLENISE